MYFPASDSIVRKHPDLLPVVELVDARLGAITSQAPLRPADFACVLGAGENEVASVFELLAEQGVVHGEDMVECERCENLMSAEEFRQAQQDEDEFECTSCGRIFRDDSSAVVVFRMTAPAMSLVQAARSTVESSQGAPPASGEEPLSERARRVLATMLSLRALDSDTRRSTKVIAVTAFGYNADENALKSVISDLKVRLLIVTRKGRGGGCWLTENGQRRAEKLGTISKTPQQFRHHLRTD